MATTVVYPYSKINVGLHVLGKRADGYHDIETLFVPHKLCDILEIIDSQRSDKDVRLFLYGLPLPGAESENLCVKTYRLIVRDFNLSPVDIHLYKQIPPGTGMGGGSSDAAFCIQLLDKHFSLGLSPGQMHHYALQLGSDVPFFLQNAPFKSYLAMGRGDVLTPFAPDLTQYRIEVRFPPVSVSTAMAYENLSLKKHNTSLKDLLMQPVDSWKYIIENDFEETVFEKHPQIEQYKTALYREGAVYASMTGSGSAVFGLFRI
ncbi:MAG: 4-(cytidine 5'-diphospho)-2-C-methyl-D-erythritol kinase [Bacteroidales bacterium]